MPWQINKIHSVLNYWIALSKEMIYFLYKTLKVNY